MNIEKYLSCFMLLKINKCNIYLFILIYISVTYFYFPVYLSKYLTFNKHFICHYNFSQCIAKKSDFGLDTCQVCMFRSHIRLGAIHRSVWMHSLQMSLKNMHCTLPALHPHGLIGL